MRHFFNFYKLILESAFPSDPKELEKILKKYRPEISQDECKNQIEELLKLKDNRTKINCFEWMKKGAVRLPEDLPKVDLALKIAKNKGINPQEFKYPQELINKYSTFFKGAELINPDDIPEFSNKEDKGNGITVYTVEDSEKGQDEVRRVLNNNYGEKFNPWCLAYGNGHGGISSKAREYWKYYNDFPKKIAFKNGKAIAFQADNLKDMCSDFVLYDDESEAKEEAEEFLEDWIGNKLNDLNFKNFIFDILKSILKNVKDLNLKNKIKETLKAKDQYKFFEKKLSAQEKNEILKLAKEKWRNILANFEEILKNRYKIKTFYKNDPEWEKQASEYYGIYGMECPHFSFVGIIDKDYKDSNSFVNVDFDKNFFFMGSDDEGRWWDLKDEPHWDLNDTLG